MIRIWLVIIYFNKLCFPHLLVSFAVKLSKNLIDAIIVVKFFYIIVTFDK